MESESPPSRTTILGSFLRGRPRNSSQSFAAADNHPRELSPPPHPPSPASRNRRPHPSGAAAAPATAGQLQPSTSQPQQSSGLALSQMLRRRRSAGNVQQQQQQSQNQNSNQAQNQQQQPPQTLPPTTQAALTLAGYPTPAMATTAAAASGGPSPAPQSQPPAATNTSALTHRIRLVPHLDSRRSLRFDPIGRDLREGDPALRIGRFTDRSGLGLSAINSLNSNKLAFRSKVVSRAHAEIWVETGGKFFIRDTKSSSGTFLNHVRLSAANMESRPFQIKDGDVLQLGVDYQGGAEDIYKSVKIRIEIGREWQAGVNAFNTNAFKNLKALALPGTPAPPNTTGKVKSLGIPDCCICLFSVTIRQALFIAPCSHTFHYKCIRPILEAHHPAFSCPLCRTFADLEEDVEVDEGSWEVGSDLDVVGKLGGGGVGPTQDVVEGEGDDDRMDVDVDGVGVIGVGVGRLSGEERPAVVLEEPEEDEADAIARNESLRPSLSPNLEGVGSGEEDIDSDIGQHPPPSHGFVQPNATATGTAIPINSANTPNNPFASNASLGVGAGGAGGGGNGGAYWGSPGAGSSASARGDSPIPINLAGPGQFAVSAGGGGGEDAQLGVVGDGIGIEGETVSGKRKR